MNDKEIAMQIVLKMLDVKALHIAVHSGTNSPEKNMQLDQENTETICYAYKTVYQAVNQASR